MQKYELGLFEKLIRQDLYLEDRTAQTPDPLFYITTIAEVHQEKERILGCFNNYAFDLKGDREIESIIQAHQHKLIYLADKISAYLTPKDMLSLASINDDITWNNLYKVIYSNLVELLTAIENDYTKYIDIYAKIPIPYLMPATQAIQQAVPFIKERFATAGIQTTLLNILMQPFEDFLQEERSTSITYHSLLYLKVLMERLTHLARTLPTDSDINKQVQDLLLELNFNSTRYYIYCTTIIKEEVASLSPKEQIERLIWMQKQLNQQPLKPGLAYMPLHNGLQDQLQRWFAEEINYLKELQNLSYSSAHSTDDILRWKGFKVQTQYSVSQLGNILRLLVDSGVYQNTNKTELLEFYACFYATARQENISPTSLRKNFYIEDAGITENVRSLLLQLLNQSKK